jgi:hypothetical protein
MARKDRVDSSSSSDDEEGRSISRKKISPSSGTSTDDRFWGLLKKLMVISGIAALFLNIHATRKLSEQFASDYEADLAEFTKPLVITIPEPIDPLGSSTQAAAAAAAGATSRARPPNKVLKILQMLDRQEKAMRPPEGLRRVVVLGKSFILKRDYSIW